MGGGFLVAAAAGGAQPADALRLAFGGAVRCAVFFRRPDFGLAAVAFAFVALRLVRFFGFLFGASALACRLTFLGFAFVFVASRLPRFFGALVGTVALVLRLIL